MNRVGGIFLFLVFCVFSSFSLAQTSVVYNVPNFYGQSHGDSLSHLTLKSACSGIIHSKSALPCNPAFLPFVKKSTFVTQIHMGDDFGSVYDYGKLLEENKNIEFVRDLINGEPIVKSQASTSLTFASDWLGISLIPYQLSYFSHVQNKYYPLVTLHGMQERIALGQVGWKFEDQLYVGLQTRFVNRKFVDDKFYFYEEIAEPTGALDVKEQNAIYLEPGLAYMFEPEWQTRLSVNVTNTGFVNKSYKEISMSPIIDAGFGFSPPLEYGVLDTSFVYRVSKDIKDQWERFRLGFVYEFDYLGFDFGWDKRDMSMSLYGLFDQIKLGVLYQQKKFIHFNGSKDYDHVVYVEAALAFF